MPSLQLDGRPISFSAGATILEAETVIVAAGWGSAALVAGAPLAPVRGQADWVEDVSGPPVAWGGYASPTAVGLLFGATHERSETAAEVSDGATEANLRTLAARLPQLASRVEATARTGRRAAVRATTPDRLPLAGELAPGLFVLTGLGSRGFCVAPLLAEHLAALATGAPSPLPASLAARVGPKRFVSPAPLAKPSPEVNG